MIRYKRSRYNRKGTIMKRNELKEIAQQTLTCFQQGYYLYENQIVDIKTQHLHSLHACKLFTAAQSEQYSFTIKEALDGVIHVENIDIIQAITKSDKKYGVLNFASAYHPGGGFLNGSLAQEESLCFGSNLYLTQLKFQKEFYDFNRAIQTKCYSDTMIYSPDIVYIRDEQYAFLPDMKFADILTSPAVNLGVALSRGENEEVCYQVMKTRMRKILTLFHEMGNQYIILGAFGCGVFRNDPKRIAQIWKELLIDEGMRFAFQDILFAVYDRSKTQNNIKAFTLMFG